MKDVTRSSLAPWLAFLSAWLAFGGGASGQADAPPPAADHSLATAVQLRQISMAVHTLAPKRDGKLAADMNDLITSGFAGEPGGVRAFARGTMVSPAHAGAIRVPEAMTPQWINEGSSFVYLGNGDVALDEVQDWAGIAIAHLRLDGGIETAPTPQNPEGRLYTVAFLDSHVELLTRADAERVISTSIQTLEALRTGGTPPADRAMVQSLGLIAGAIKAYAAANNGLLPADLGLVLEFIPKTRLTATPAQRARVFLTPAAAANTHIPDEPTPEWVRRHTSYVYLGDPGVRIADIPDPFTIVLVHARPDDAVEITGIGGAKSRLRPVATVGGSATCEPQEYAAWICAEARKAIAALAQGSDLPDWLDATRDVRDLGEAVVAYAKANDDRLPPDLASVFELLPGATARERAAAYLSPRAWRVQTIPEAPDGAWLAQHASYVYVGNDGLSLKSLRDGGEVVLIHARPEEPYAVRERYSPAQVVPFYTTFGQTARWNREHLAEFMARGANDNAK